MRSGYYLGTAKPAIFDADQGSRFTSAAFTGLLLDNGITISMGGRGSWRNNIFVERLWRSVKYGEIYLQAYEAVAEARRPIGRYLISSTASGHIQALAGGRRTTPTSLSCR